MYLVLKDYDLKVAVGREFFLLLHRGGYHLQTR
jgi:hypothetical protein